MLRRLLSSSASVQIASETFTKHIPVLLNETIDALQIKEGRTYLDLTFGAGGHSRRILENGGKVIAIDRDPVAVEQGQALLEEYPDDFKIHLAKFSQLRNVLLKENIPSVDGVLIDCGCSSMQLDDEDRGFSVRTSAKLDMRMNPDEEPAQPTAAEVLNSLDARDLSRIFKIYGEEKNANKIAQAVVDYKFQMKSLTHTDELVKLVESCFDEDHSRHDSLGRKTNLATKVFMALRIFVNDELNELNKALILAHHVLKKNSRAAVISFHSLEDRIIKRHFAGINIDEPISHSLSQKTRNASKWNSSANDQERKWEVINSKPILPTEEEIERNSRSRSAKLRVAAKL